MPAHADSTRPRNSLKLAAHAISDRLHPFSTSSARVAHILRTLLACYERKSSEAAHFGYCIILLGHIFDTEIDLAFWLAMNEKEAKLRLLVIA